MTAKKEGLFLGNYRYESPRGKIVEELRKEKDDLEKKILAGHHGYQAISKQLEEEQKKLDRWFDHHRERGDKLRKAIQDYVDKINKET